MVYLIFLYSAHIQYLIHLLASFYKYFPQNLHIDKRNDNQCDIHRGSEFTYKNESQDKIVNVYMNKSRNGKTIDWEFRTFKNASDNLLLRAKKS